MSLISIKFHGFLDYVTVTGFAVLPSLFHLSGIPAYLSYTLALIHFLMTALTRFPLGMVKVVPVMIHRIVEMIVGPVLLFVPWVLGFSTDTTARNVYLGAGTIILLVGFLTNYFEERA